MMILVFIFYEFLAGISMYYASGYILKKTYKKLDYNGNSDDDNSSDSIIKIASFMAGLTYMFSYFLIFNFKYPQHRVAYALAPIIFLSLIVGLENKKLKYIILTGFLWCVACADMHWTVDGAILLFSVLIFYFIFDIIKSSHKGKLKAFKKSLFFYSKSSIVLVISFICFSAYWFIPGLLMGGTSRYSSLIHAEYLELTNAQSTMINIITKQASYFQTDVVYANSSGIFSSSAIQTLLILLGLVVFIIGMMALLLKRKNRYVLFFSLFILISIFLVAMVNFLPEFGLWVITKAPLHDLYGWDFKWGIISQFVIFSLCFLLGFSIVEILIKIKRAVKK